VVGIVAAALIVGVVLGTARNFREIDPATERTPYAGDFLHEWTGGWTWRSGERLRLYDPAYADEIQHDERLVGFRLVSDGFLPMVYPPVYYAAVSPLAALPYRTAAWVWAALTLGAFAVTAALLARAVAPGGALAERVPVAAPDWDRFRNVGTMAALPAAVAFLPFAENLVTSQKGTFVLLVWTATLLALLAGRPLLAGLAFGLLAVKPQLAFVLVAVMAVKRQWAFVAGVGATTGVLAALSVLPDPELARRYVECVRTIGEQIRLAPRQLHRMHGIYGFFTTLLGGVTPAARWLAAGVWTATVIATLAVLRGPLAPGSSRFVVQYCALAVATVLLTPNVVHYDLTLLLLPLFVLGWMLGRGAFPGGRGRAVLWGLVALYVACGVGPPIARATGFQPTFPVLVTLLVLLRAETIERRGAVG
jgi:hypothetical protein